MNNFNSDEEVVEALKKWWDENGKSVVVGAVIGLSLVYGWRFYGEQKIEQSAMASDHYISLQQSLLDQDNEAAKEKISQFQTQQSDSIYAVLASLDMAKAQITANQLAEAEVNLQWAIDHAANDQIKQIAIIRLARILLSESKPNKAKQVIAQAKNDQFRGELADIRGDIARVNKDFDAAKLAYQEALANRVSNANLVRMKMDDLGLN